MIAVIGFTIDGLEAAKESDVKRWVKSAFFDMGAEWHKKYRRPHFSQRAYSKYNYTPRSRTYNRFKKKHLGHTIPLVKTGTSRRLSESHKVVATPEGSRVTMPVRVFNFKTKKSKVDKRKEFTTVAADEKQKLDRRATFHLERDIQRFKKTIVEDI